MATVTTVTNVSGSAAQTAGRTLDDWGTRRVGLFRVSNTGTYAAGGIAFDPRAFGFDMPVAAVFLSVRSVAASLTVRVEYDYAAAKIKFIVTSTGVELGAVDVSTVVIDAIVISE